VGDYPEEADVTISAGPGAKVTITGGGGGAENSNCTDQEKADNADFTTSTYVKATKVRYIAKDGGGCGLEASYSNFRITITQPDGKKLTGRMWLGQLWVATSYFASCYSGSGGDVNHRNYEWSQGIGCIKTGDFSVIIATP
jgi:hypothetical protein